MALADLIVVMNDGRIEQAATPREVFEKPATAFVARFMGDHNVISGALIERGEGTITISLEGNAYMAGGSAPADDITADIAIRTDRVRISDNAPYGSGFLGTITNVEYLGSTVKLNASSPGIEEFTVILSDKDFFARPVKVGDLVPLAWDVADATVLGRII